MKFVKKILYWITIIPPFIDVLKGAIRGVIVAWYEAKEANKNEDLMRYLNDNS